MHRLSAYRLINGFAKKLKCLYKTKNDIKEIKFCEILCFAQKVQTINIIEKFK